MKKTLFVLFVSFFWLSLFAQNDNTYIIKGNLPNELFNNKMLYLAKFDPELRDKQIYIDSVKVENGLFELKGEVEDNCSLYYIKIQNLTSFIIIEPGILNVTYTEYTPNGYIYPTGTVLNEQLYNEIIYPPVQFMHFEDSLVQLEDKGKLILKNEKLLMEEYDKMGEGIFTKYYQFTKNNIEYPFGKILLLNMVDALSDNLIKDFEPYLDESILTKINERRAKVKELRNRPIVSENALVGKPFINFEIKDINNLPVKLSDLAKDQKLILLDFWASWCRPCIKDMPHLAKMKEKYEDSGLKIIGVSLDKDENAWKGAIEKYHMNWIQLIDNNGDIVREMYGIEYIPYTILIDENGIIINRNLRGEELENVVDKLLKQ